MKLKKLSLIFICLFTLLAIYGTYGASYSHSVVPFAKPAAGEDCTFCTIIKNKKSGLIIDEMDHVIVIEDISPRDIIHYLIIPKKHIRDISHLDYKDKATALELMLMVQKLSNLPGFSKFKLIQNNGELARQTQFHIHIHFRVKREHFNTPIPVYIKPLQCDFCNIITQVKPATIIKETDTIIVINQEEFRYLSYEKAIHTIHWRIIPKKHISDLSQLNPEDYEMVVQMLFMAQTLSQESSDTQDTQQFRLFNNADPALAWKQASHLHFDFTAGYKEKTNPKPRITSRTEPSSTTLTKGQALILGGIVVTGALIASKKGDCCIS